MDRDGVKVGWMKADRSEDAGAAIGVRRVR
jgi:hypothetical protein